MKNLSFTKAFLPAGFALGLFASQQNFMLISPDNTAAGLGMFETGTDGTIQARATIEGTEFAGAGRMSASPQRNPAQRSDRAFLEWLGKPRPQHGMAYLTAKNGAAFACEFNIDGTQADPLNGHCMNVKDHRDYTVHTSAGSQP